jgi:hypothetical protein
MPLLSILADAYPNLLLGISIYTIYHFLPTYHYKLPFLATI